MHAVFKYNETRVLIQPDGLGRRKINIFSDVQGGTPHMYINCSKIEAAELSAVLSLDAQNDCPAHIQRMISRVRAWLNSQIIQLPPTHILWNYLPNEPIMTGSFRVAKYEEVVDHG